MQTRVKVLYNIETKRFMNIEAGRVVATDTPKVYPANIDRITLAIIGEWPTEVGFVDAVISTDGKDFIAIKKPH